MPTSLSNAAITEAPALADDQPPATLASFVLPEHGLVLEELERELVRQALERTRGNQTHAARLLGVTRDQIRYRLRKFDLSRAGTPRA